MCTAREDTGGEIEEASFAEYYSPQDSKEYYPPDINGKWSWNDSEWLLRDEDQTRHTVSEKQVSEICIKVGEGNICKRTPLSLSSSVNQSFNENHNHQRIQFVYPPPPSWYIFWKEVPLKYPSFTAVVGCLSADSTPNLLAHLRMCFLKNKNPKEKKKDSTYVWL